MAITITKIAELAGVSRAAVDKVLHNRPGISDEVRKKVLNIVKEYEYQPNIVARALKANARNLTFAVIIPPPEHLLFKSVREGMEAAFDPYKAYGLQLQYFYSEGTDEKELLDLLDEICAREFSGVAMRGLDTPAICKKINHMAKRKIPVITFDSDVSCSSRLCFIGEDHIKNGNLAATLLSKCLQENSEVAIVNGTSLISGHRLRAQGFFNAIKEKHPFMKVVRHVEMLEDDTLAYDMTCQLLADFPDLRGIFIAAGCARQVYDAVESMQRDVHLIAYNFVPDVGALVKNGHIDFAIGLMPFQEGEMVINMLYNVVVDHKSPENSIFHTPTYICVEDNIDAFF